MLLIVGFAAIAFTVSLLPKQASAFWWPFGVNADAAGSGVVPSSSTPTLKAPTNSNPNASAPIALATSGDALVSNTGPSGAAANEAGIASDRISVYVVRPGDTMSDIAKMFGVSVNTIVWANNLKSVNDVHPGDTLIILPVSGIERTIVKGDTLQSLAKKFGADAGEIAAYNGLDPGAPLAVGSTVIIPGGELSVPVAPIRSKTPREPLHDAGGIALPGFFINPVPGALLTQGLHGWNAVDLGAARGTPIYAAAGGIVIIAKNGGAWNGGYGNYVVITHDNGVQTLYSHMRHAIVSPGQAVGGGQLIGYVGATGLATGPHLHFEVRGAANPFANCPTSSVCSPQ